MATNATELETLLVRLTGDAASYTKMLKDAADSAQKTAKSIEGSAAKIEGFQQKLEGYGKSIVGVAKNVAGAFASIGIGVGLFKAYEKFEQAELGALRLAKAIEMQGGNVKETTAQYSKFAIEMAKVTSQSKGVTMGLLQEATAIGLTADQAQRAVKNAIALGAQKNTDAQTFLRDTAMLEKGVLKEGISASLGLPMRDLADGAKDAAHSIDELGQSMEGQTKDAAKVAQAQEKLNKLFGIAEVQGRSTQSEIERLKTSMGGFQKEVGALVAVALRPTIEWLAKLTQKINSLDPTTKKIIAGIVLLTGAILAVSAAAPTVMTAIAGIKTGITALSAATGMGITPLTLYTAAAVAIAYAAYKIVDAVYKANDSVKSLNRSMEESAILQGKQMQQREASLKRILEQANQKPEGEREGFLKEELEATKKEVDGFNRLIQSVKSEADEAANYLSNKAPPWWLSPAGKPAAEMLEGILPNKPLDDINARLKEHQANLELSRKKAEQLGEALKALELDKSGEPANKELKKDLDALNKSLIDQAGALAQGATEYEIWKLKVRGATEEQLRSLRAAAAAVEHQNLQKKKFEEMQAAQQKLVDDGKALAQELMTPQEKFIARVAEVEKLFKAGVINEQTYLRGISEAQKTFEDTADSVKELREELQAINGVAFGSAAAIERINQYRESLVVPVAPTRPGTGMAEKAIADAREAEAVQNRVMQFVGPLLPDLQAPERPAVERVNERVREGGGPVQPAIDGNNKAGTDLANVLLKQILEQIKEQNKKPEVNVKPAGWF